MLDTDDIDNVDNYAFLPRNVYKKLELPGPESSDLSLCFMMKRMMLLIEMKKSHFLPVVFL